MRWFSACAISIAACASPTKSASNPAPVAPRPAVASIAAPVTVAEPTPAEPIRDASHCRNELGEHAAPEKDRVALGLAGIVDDEADAIRAQCANAPNAVNATAEGLVDLWFRVGPTGIVEATCLDEDRTSLREPAIVSCIVDAIAKLRFARAVRAGQTTARVGFWHLRPEPQKPVERARLGPQPGYGSSWRGRGSGDGMGIGDRVVAGAGCPALDHCVTNPARASCSSLTSYECKRNCELGCIVCACELFHRAPHGL